MADHKQGSHRTSFGLFQREQRSLFGEILDWMLTPLLLLWPLSLVLTWFVAQGIASKPYDRALEFNLQALTQFVVVRDGQVQFNLTNQARDLLRADDTDLVYYQVRNARGELVSLTVSAADALADGGVLVVGGESFGRQERELSRNVDFVVATPLLRGLREKYPGCTVDYFGGARTRDLEAASALLDSRFSLFGESGSFSRLPQLSLTFEQKTDAIIVPSFPSGYLLDRVI